MPCVLSATAPGQVEELGLFGKRKSSIRRSARAYMSARAAAAAADSKGEYWHKLLIGGFYLTWSAQIGVDMNDLWFLFQVLELLKSRACSSEDLYFSHGDCNEYL